MKKILIVEDHADTIEMEKSMLSIGNYEVIAAYDGAGGLAKAALEKPDLILLDVMMPGMDGFEVCRKLKADPATAKIPVIIVSVKAVELDKKTAKEVGADDYIIKPFDPQVLMQAINKLLP